MDSLEFARQVPLWLYAPAASNRNERKELYSLLDTKQLDGIHLTTLNVLQRTGVVRYDNDTLNLLIERGKVFTRPGSAYTKVLDMEARQCRNGALKDTEMAAKVVDVLENISFCATHVSPSDGPPNMADIPAVKVCL